MSRATVVQIIAMVCVGWVVTFGIVGGRNEPHLLHWRPATELEQRQSDADRLAEEKAQLRELLRQQPRGPVAPGRTDDRH